MTSTATATATIPPSPEPLLSTREVMAWLHLSRNTLCHYSSEGKIPCFRFPDGSYRYDRHALEQWLKQRSTK